MTYKAKLKRCAATAKSMPAFGCFDALALFPVRANTTLGKHRSRQHKNGGNRRPLQTN